MSSFCVLSITIFMLMFTKQTIFSSHLNRQIRPIKIEVTNLRCTEKGFYKSGFEYAPNFKNFVLTAAVCKQRNDKRRRSDANCCEDLIEGLYTVSAAKMVQGTIDCSEQVIKKLFDNIMDQNQLSVLNQITSRESSEKVLFLIGLQYLYKNLNIRPGD